MLKIDLLKNHPDTIVRLSLIWEEVLGRVWIPDFSIDRVEQKFRQHLNDRVMPITFVALDNNQPVGMCSLRENDGIRPDLVPWLASLVVDPKYQKKGIAKQLIESAKQKAIELGFKKLYLLAFDATIPTYYASLGWHTIGVDELVGHPVTVMEIIL